MKKKKMYSPGLFFFVVYKVAPNVLLVIDLIMRKVSYQLIHCYGFFFFFLLVFIQFISKYQGGK